jgi:hypothetical protein
MTIFEEFAADYVEMVQEGLLHEARELAEEFQADNGWGPGEEAAIEMMLQGQASHPAGEPGFNDGLFRHALRPPSAVYKYDAMAKAYVTLCRAGREDLAEELAACGRNYIFAGPGADQEFTFAIERFADESF